MKKEYWIFLFLGLVYFIVSVFLPFGEEARDAVRWLNRIIASVGLGLAFPVY